jgi:hypothetical protein
MKRRQARRKTDDSIQEPTAMSFGRDDERDRVQTHRLYQPAVARRFRKRITSSRLDEAISLPIFLAPSHKHPDSTSSTRKL